LRARRVAAACRGLLPLGIRTAARYVMGERGL
jgi:hypothetical protein